MKTLEGGLFFFPSAAKISPSTSHLHAKCEFVHKRPRLKKDKDSGEALKMYDGNSVL